MADKKKFPRNAAGYQLKQPIGKGSQATVWLARCIPTDEEVAIKIIDLMNCTTNIDSIRGHFLWVVMELLAGGSCLDVMKFTSTTGFGEVLIATILYQALKGLDYFHKTGRIHCDVKAGNMVISSNGTVKLSDFGVSAWLTEHGERKALGQMFVGTPCWMAPEVIEQRTGYDYRADIWSFGITALELARGEAPLAKFPPMKVLMMTLQNSPPRLDAEEKERYSKHFKDLIHCCLQKEPERRPSASKLLEHKFFRPAKGPEYIANTLLDKLPPLYERLKVTHPKLDIPKELALLWTENKSTPMTARNGDDKFLWDFGGDKMFKTPKSIRKKEKEEKKRAKKLKKLKKQQAALKAKIDRGAMMTRTQSARSAENLFEVKTKPRTFTVQKVNGRSTPFSMTPLPTPRRHSDSYDSSSSPSSHVARISRTNRVQSDIALPHIRGSAPAPPLSPHTSHNPSPLSFSAPHPAVTPASTPTSLSLSIPTTNVSASTSLLPLNLSSTSSTPLSLATQPHSPTLLSSLLSAEPLHPLHQPLTPQPVHSSASTSQQSLMQQQIFAIFQQNIHHTKMLQSILDNLPPRISTEKETDEPVGCDPLVLVDALSTMQHQVAELIKENQRLQKENQELKKKLQAKEAKEKEPS